MKFHVFSSTCSLLTIWIFGLLPIFAGCGPSTPATYPVYGKVVFPDGSPLKGGEIEFEPKSADTEKINARAPIQLNGTFSLTTFKLGDGALPGPHRVLVRAPRAQIQPEDMKPGEEIPKPIIDPRFERYETSGLEFTVDKKSNDFTIQVIPPQSKRR
jgi:hypothetical protein